MVEITRGGDAATKTAPPATVPGGSARAVAPAVPGSPARPRRRPALIGGGVALLALGGLTSAWLVSSTGDTVPVLAMAADVQRGEVIDRAYPFREVPDAVRYVEAGHSRGKVVVTL